MILGNLIQLDRIVLWCLLFSYKTELLKSLQVSIGRNHFEWLHAMT